MLGLFGCDKPAASGTVSPSDSSEVTNGALDSSAGTSARKPKAPEDSTAVVPGDGLGALDGMTLETSMEMDDFRGRLEHDWGDVHNILRASGASFAPEGKDYLVMKGEVKQGGFPWAAIMVVDLKQDAVFAAQFDGENKRIDQFEEEKEGLTQPAPLSSWTKQYR